MMVYEWLKNIEFANVWMLPFLGIIPVLAWLHYRMRFSLKSTVKVTTADAFHYRTARNFWVKMPFVLRLLAITCIIIALARPQTKNILRQTTGEGIDIILCIDVSGSMLTPDFVPNRMEAAKQVAIEFVKSRPVDQIGLVIFSAESFTLAPLTSDHQMVIEQLKGLKGGLLRDGTLIGEGLATSVERLSKSKSKTKVVILLTDGKESESSQVPKVLDPYTALEIAKLKGVKVYVVGLNAGTNMAERGEQSGAKGIDETMLKRIAIQTGGQYFRATDNQVLQEIYQQIDRFEKSKVEVKTRERIDEKFLPFIIAALFFLFMEVLLRYLFIRTFP